MQSVYIYVNDVIYIKNYWSESCLCQTLLIQYNGFFPLPGDHPQLQEEHEHWNLPQAVQKVSVS